MELGQRELHEKQAPELERQYPSAHLEHTIAPPLTVQAKHPTDPPFATVVQAEHVVPMTAKPTWQLVHEAAEHCRQLALHATQLEPESRQLVRHPVQVEAELQVEQPAGQAAQTAQLALVALQYPELQEEQKVLSVQVVQLAWHATHFPSCKKKPEVQPWHSPSAVIELHPQILMHWPPSRQVLLRAGQEEQTKAVETIWEQHSPHPTLTALMAVGQARQF